MTLMNFLMKARCLLVACVITDKKIKTLSLFWWFYKHQKFLEASFAS